MNLSDWISGEHPAQRAVVTAKSAILAKDAPQQAGAIASIASVAIATPGNPTIPAPESSEAGAFVGVSQVATYDCQLPELPHTAAGQIHERWVPGRWSVSAPLVDELTVLVRDMGGTDSQARAAVDAACSEGFDGLRVTVNRWRACNRKRETSLGAQCLTTNELQTTCHGGW